MFRSFVRFLSTVAVVAVLGALAVPAANAAAHGAPRGSAAASGTLRLAASEELYCADWISSCAGLSWGSWSLGVETMPQAFQVTAAGEFVPGPMLAGEPTVDNGPPLRITYRIDPAAVWSDGVAMTAADFAYTWQQIVTGQDIYDKTGYDKIASIDTSDPATAVVTFSEPFAPWRDLFSGFYYVLPSHLLAGKDRHAAMKDGYSFSGGPWKLDGGKKGWVKGKTLTLVPNPRWWRTKPSIGKVVFQFIPDSAAATQAMKTRQVLAAFPLPQTGILDQFEQAGLQTKIGFGTSYEGLWLNESKAPLDDLAVRQALLYATDRQALVDQISKPSVRQGRVLQSFLVPTFPEYYSPAFDRYTANPGKVDTLMKGAGWTKGADGLWVRNGQKATIEASTTAGNKNRELLLQVWQSQLRAAGFDLVTTFASPDLLFGKALPQGTFTVALYTSTGTPDPGLCALFCSVNIPTKANGFVGQNLTRTRSAAVDAVWGAVDREIDPVARIQAVLQGQQVLADEAVSIPLFQQPDILVWDGQRISGPLEDNSVMGPFWNLELWTLK
ncbi:MAG: peptide ABC transporter substrate-binding protein [Actinomycetes bacterium]